jgi:3-hydroxyisobutyrate dehydrogenase-like beta-hydroxyacid dehydrogenase
VAATPAEVIRECSVTFAMLADPPAALAVVEGPDGVASAIGPGKAYVDVSTVDEATSQKIAGMITQAGGRFLEAPVSGSKKPAIDGQLIFLTAGNKSLFDDCKPAFDVMGKEAVFLGDVGAGARMKLTVNMIMGSMMCALPSLSMLCELPAFVPYMAST